MKKKLFYTAPQARFLEIETQSVIASSIDPAGIDDIVGDDDYFEI